MAGGSKKMDKYANVLTASLTLSAANTLSFDELKMGLSLFDKVGLLISRIEYEPSGGTLGEMTATGDEVRLAITTSDSISALDVTDQAVIHMMTYKRFDAGTAATATLYTLPFVYDLSTLPGAGILITPRPWYIAGDTDGLASAAVLNFRFYFTVIKLSPAEYFELLETRQYFG